MPSKTSTKPLKVDSKKSFYATGRRKASVARVYLQKGSGKTSINGKTIAEYFGEGTRWHYHAITALTTLEVAGDYDIIAFIKGGGVNGQAGALRLGIARALDSVELAGSPDTPPSEREWHCKLKKAGLLTSDSRQVLRKLVGLVKARRAKQFSKR